MSKSTERSFEQLRRANPVPDPAQLRRQLQGYEGAATKDWSSEMTDTTVQTRPKPHSSSKRNWRPVAAILALVAVGLPVGIHLATRTPVGSGELTALEIAERYVTARNDHDAEGMRAVLSEDVRNATDKPPHDVSELETLAELERVAGFTYADPMCVIPDGLADWVRCTYSFSSRFHSALDLPPSEGEFLIAVDDGTITIVNHAWSDEMVEAWLPFSDFLEDQGVRGRMYWPGIRGPLLTQESVELHRQYLDLYEQGASS